MTKTPSSFQRRPVQNRSEIEAYIAERPPVEMNMARGIVSRVKFVGPILVALFAIFTGIDGAIASAAGVAMVVVYYLFTGWILSMTARVSLGTYYAGALFGFFVRIALIGITMAVLADQLGLDRVALGASVAATYVALLMWEAATFRRVSERKISAERDMGDKSSV